MRHRIPTFALAATLLTGGTAFAATADEIRQVVRQVVPTGDVHVQMEDGVILLTGNVKDAMERTRVVNAVRTLDGVIDVQDAIVD